jgi:hypothetical protein
MRVPAITSATPAEAAAIVAALERFMRDTAPARSSAEPRGGSWARAAILEGVIREERTAPAWRERDPWQDDDRPQALDQVDRSRAIEQALTEPWINT